MEQPIANKDVMTTKLSGNVGSSKKESFPLKAFLAPSHSFTECSVPALWSPAVNQIEKVAPDRHV